MMMSSLRTREDGECSKNAREHGDQSSGTGGKASNCSYCLCFTSAWYLYALTISGDSRMDRGLISLLGTPHLRLL